MCSTTVLGFPTGLPLLEQKKSYKDMSILTCSQQSATCSLTRIGSDIITFKSC